MALSRPIGKGVNVVPAVLGIVLLGAVQQSTPIGWRGIVPLHSTRADVERLLGPGEGGCKCGYNRDDFNASFVYSTSDCEGEGSGGFDVPADTVLSITVYQKPRAKLSDLGLDESRFEESPPIGDLIDYADEEQGLRLEVYQGSVQSFHYLPTRADEKMRCPGYDIFNASGVPKEARVSLLDRLNEFVECSRLQQYEKQYTMYLPEFARMMFRAENAKQFAELMRESGPPVETVIEFTPQSISMQRNSIYGEVFEISGRAKSDYNGNIVETYRTTGLVLRSGQWYFVNELRQLPD